MSIKIENAQIFGWEGAIRGARNPMNSWDKSDSWFNFDSWYASDGDRDCGIDTHCAYSILGEESEEWEWDQCPLEGDWCESEWKCEAMILGPADHKLLMNLCKGGTEEAKWRRMVHVQMDITAPLYWWKEFETYKVGTTSNSCSTMHKIHSKPFTKEDFSFEHIITFGSPNEELNLENPDISKEYCALYYEQLDIYMSPEGVTEATLNMLNRARFLFLETGDKKYWWQMIQLLPTSYNQRRTIDLNYEVLASQYRQRKEHKLDEWREYCEWIKTLPYSEFITVEENND